MKKKKSTNPQIQKQKKKINKGRVIKVILLVIVIVIASVGVFFGVTVVQQISSFSKDALLNKEASTQVSVLSDDKEYYSYGSEGTRKNVAYDDIPQVMIDAVVAAEDSRYFEHNGFDLPRIVKAFMGNIVAGGITGGGSTITQQVIKNSFYPNAEKENLIQGLQRKTGEIVLSIKTTSETTKEEVLELYLNKVYFGYGNKTIGIYAASRYYFDKDVQDLTLPEAALLAGTLNSPNQFDPFKNLEKAQNRRDTILKLMLQHGYITENEYEKTKAIPVENTLKSNPINTGGAYQAYADMVTREVIEKTGYDPQETPMKIYTYLNTDLQEKLDGIASGELYDFSDEDLQTGAVVQETKNGRVVGVLSARDYEPLGSTNAYAKKGVKEGGYGNVHQPGSSLKPIIAYAAAFEYLDWSTAHYVHDIPSTIKNYNPKNWDNKFHGDISISEALSQSWNLAAIQTYLEVRDEIGDEKIQNYLEGFGFDMTKEELAVGYAIGGWKYGTTPQEEAAAYAAIANGGTYIEPHCVAKIELLTTGEVINIDEEANAAKSQAISEESAFMIRSVMTDYVKSSSNYSRLNMGLQIGAKTGTSNWPSTSNIPSKLRGKSKDSWMSAYSPDYSWSVWVGYPDKVARDKGKYLKSGNDSKKISALIAKYVHNGRLKNSYPSQPSGVVKSTCISGIYPYVKPGDGVPQDRIVSGYFKKNNMPSGSANGASLNNLSSFDAKLVNGKIQVTFTEYNPKSMTEDNPKPTKKYGSYTLPYLGDISQIYGKVVYVAEVTDSTGKVVHTEKLSTATATLKYTPQSGNYTVTGYYAFDSGNGTSNKIQKSISVATQLGASYSKVSLTSTQLVLKLNIPSGNTVTVSINGGESQTVSKSSNVTFNNLVAGQQYKITFVEKASDGKTKDLSPYTFTTPSDQTVPENPDDGNQTDNPNE